MLKKEKEFHVYQQIKRLWNTLYKKSLGCTRRTLENPTKRHKRYQ